MDTYTPARLLQRHLNEILTHLTGAFDGDVESVHRARVATRRLREVVPLVDDPQRDHVADSLKAAGRHLGRVRELDVMSSLLDTLGHQMTADASAALYHLHRSVRERLRQARREMVKELEHLDLWALRDSFAAMQHTGLRRWVTASVHLVTPLTPHWAEPVWSRISERSADAVAATHRAPAIYFPRRAHRVRVAVKKLRYAIEIAAETGLWRPQHVLKDLQKIQRTLGNIHDLQVLNDLIDSAPATNGDAAQRSVLKDMVDADIARQQGDYARRRNRIFDIADACARAASRRKWHVLRPVIAASAFTAPLVIASVAATTRPGLDYRARRDSLGRVEARR